MRADELTPVHVVVQMPATYEMKATTLQENFQQLISNSAQPSQYPKYLKIIEDFTTCSIRRLCCQQQTGLRGELLTKYSLCY